MPEPALGYELKSERTGGAVVIELAGEVDIEIAPIEDAIKHAMQSDAEEITLDISGLSFMGSRCIQALLLLGGRREGDDERRVRITGASGQVLQVLELTGTDQKLPLD